MAMKHMNAMEILNGKIIKSFSIEETKKKNTLSASHLLSKCALSFLISVSTFTINRYRRFHKVYLVEYR